MKKIFSRVAHVFKHDVGDEQQDPGDASPPSPAVGDPGEHASLTSVDSGVLVDVSEPERSPTGAGAGTGTGVEAEADTEAEAEAELVAPVTDRVRECAKLAAGNGADWAACSEADRTTQTAAGQITTGEGQQPEMVEAAGDSEREQEIPTYTVNEGEYLYEAEQKQKSTAGIVNVQQESLTATVEVTAVTVPERPEPEGLSEVQRAGPGSVQKQTTPTQEQDPVTGVKQEPQEPVLSSQQQVPVSEGVEEQEEQELVEELAEAPAAVERPVAEPSGDLQSGAGLAAAAAAGAADSAGPDHPGLPGTAAAELAPSSRQELPVEADSVNGGQDRSDSCVETNRSVTVGGMPVETVESAPVSPADKVEPDVTADGSDNVTVQDEPSAMDAEGVGRAAEEPSATGDPPVTDSDGMLLETGTEDTADDLDGKPKEKRKKRKKKRKNKSEQSTPVSLVAEALAKDADKDKAKAALSEEMSEKPTDGVKKVMAEPSGQTVGSDAADSKTKETKTKVSSSLTAGTRASTAKAKKSTASQAARNPMDPAVQRDGSAKTKSGLAKQSTTEASGSRSATPTRPLQNPVKSRLKTQLRKETSVESNASSSSRGSSGARSARSGKRSSATGTTPADQSGACANSAARRDSLPLSISSGSTTVSTRGEDASSRRARTKGAKQQADKSTPAARSSTPTTKKKSDAVSAAKSPPERKTSAVTQAGNAKKEKKTKAPILKDKKVSGAKKTLAVTKGSDAKSASPARAPGATGTKTKASDVAGTNDAFECKESVGMTAQPASDHSLPSQQTVTESSAQGSPERPPLLEQDTLEDTSVLRPPLTQYDTVQDSTERSTLSQQEAVEASRPPRTHNDTIDDPADRPVLVEQDTLEDTSVLRPPTVQHDTAHGASPDRPPLVQQETIDPSVTDITSLSSGQPTASCHSSVGQPSSVATQSTAVVAETAVPQVTLSPSSAAAPTSPSTAAVPTSPSAPSDGSSRRSSTDVLDGLPRLRRSISGHGEQAGAPRPDAVLEAMSQVHADSEARLAARRQARAEAREIRMRELERQQREAEQNGERLDDFSDVSPRPAPSAVSSRASRGPSAASTGRRGSEDSAEDGASTSSGGFHLRDVRHELRELEEKLRKTMVTSAQLDNDKSTLSYQVELLKDKLEEMQEAHTQLQREHRARCSEHEQLKRVSNRLREDYECCKTLLEERDKLIAENGLVLVGDEEDDSEPESAASAQRPHKALVSQNAAQLLDKAGGGTLDSRLRRLGEEKNELEDQLRRLKLELEEERHMSARARISGSGAGAESDQVQREVARQVGEYRFKLQKADQDITNLQTAVQRLENQVARYKAAAETAEKSEEELKGEKRKLQRELRESLTRVDELETTNSHLQKRLDKLKNARSALLKDLSTE